MGDPVCYFQECGKQSWNFCGRCGNPSCQQHSIEDSSCEEGYICADCKQMQGRLLRTRNPGPLTIIRLKADGAEADGADIKRILESEGDTLTLSLPLS